MSSQSWTRVKLNSVFFVRFLASPKFPHVPLGVGGWPLGYRKSKRGKKAVQHLVSFSQTHNVTAA